MHRIICRIQLLKWVRKKLLHNRNILLILLYKHACSYIKNSSNNIKFNIIYIIKYHLIFITSLHANMYFKDFREDGINVKEKYECPTKQNL